MRPPLLPWIRRSSGLSSSSASFSASPRVRGYERRVMVTPDAIGLTASVMLSAELLACIGPAGRALRINPSKALREARTAVVSAWTLSTYQTARERFSATRSGLGACAERSGVSEIADEHHS